LLAGVHNRGSLRFTALLLRSYISDTAIAFDSIPIHTAIDSSPSSTSKTSSTPTTSIATTTTTTTATTTTTTATTTHFHKIPNILIFTHYENFLLPPPYRPSSPPSTDAVRANASSNNDSHFNNNHIIYRPTKEEELRALRKNCHHTISLYLDAKVRFLTDDECLTSITNVVPFLNLPNTSSNNATTSVKMLMEYFTAEPNGSYRGLLCRGAALYESGSSSQSVLLLP
jgi:hypothetical protein